MDRQDQSSMSYFESHAHSFVLRIWQESAEDPESPGEWRGWIEHVQSGQRHYFGHVTELSAIVAGYVGEETDLDDQVFMPLQAKTDSENQ
jgi:hypothetical protein